MTIVSYILALQRTGTWAAGSPLEWKFLAVISNKNVKNLCAILQNLVHVSAVALFKHATKYAFVPVDEDQWFCFCQESNSKLLKLRGWFMYCQKFYVLPALCICIFCTDLTTSSDYFTAQHWLTGFYNRDGVCLLRGTDRVYTIRVNPLYRHV
jgi:hypothetical protein